MPCEFCCQPAKDRIRNKLPVPKDEQLLNLINQLAKSNPNCPRISNRDLRPVLQHAFCCNATASNFSISGIPHALDTYCQFPTSVHAVFSRSDQGLPMLRGDSKQIIAFIPSPDETLQGHLRDQLNSVRGIAALAMNEPDEGMNPTIFNAEGLLLNKQDL
jgi:hypothetical protein